MDVTPSLLTVPWACMPLQEIRTQDDTTLLMCADCSHPQAMEVVCLPEHRGLFSVHAHAFQQWCVDRATHEQVCVPVLLTPGAPRFFPEADLLSMLQTAANMPPPPDLVDTIGSPV
jgi:hypothetical protein